MDLELDVYVDDGQVLGEVDEGFRLAMWALEGGRIAIAAQALGIGDAAVNEAISYAKQRKTFGRPIASYQAIQWMLADMATELEAARLLTLKAADAKGRQASCALEASMAKLFASETAERICSDAIQTLGGAGYIQDFGVERIYRGVRGAKIYEGTNDIQRLVISRSLTG